MGRTPDRRSAENRPDGSAGTDEVGRLRVRDLVIPRQERAEADQVRDWSALVDEFGPAVWSAARAAASTRQRAAETCQLVWLRLELRSRRDGLPADLARWLGEQVADVAQVATRST